MTLLEEDKGFQEASVIVMYYSLPDEVDTHDFIERWHGRKHILLPVVNGDLLQLRTYTGTASMKEGAYGILEPRGESFTNYNLIDLIAVPGMAFDRQGNRLGRGRGYYDRFLPLAPQADRVGICFPFQLIDEVPTEPTDIAMNRIITCL